jgi:hypothetical protein
VLLVFTAAVGAVGVPVRAGLFSDALIGVLSDSIKELPVFWITELSPGRRLKEFTVAPINLRESDP